MTFQPSKDDFFLKSEAGVSWYLRREGGELHIGASQDCTPIIEANKASQNSGGTGYMSDKTFRHAARVPVAVQLEWLTKYGVDIHSQDPGQQKKVAALLNSNEYRYLRPFEWKI